VKTARERIFAPGVFRCFASGYFSRIKASRCVQAPAGSLIKPRQKPAATTLSSSGDPATRQACDQAALLLNRDDHHVAGCYHQHETRGLHPFPDHRRLLVLMAMNEKKACLFREKAINMAGLPQI
jgi:hypothetical protein